MSLLTNKSFSKGQITDSENLHCTKLAKKCCFNATAQHCHCSFLHSECSFLNISNAELLLTLLQLFHYNMMSLLATLDFLEKGFPDPLVKILFHCRQFTRNHFRARKKLHPKKDSFLKPGFFAIFSSSFFTFPPRKKAAEILTAAFTPPYPDNMTSSNGQFTQQLQITMAEKPTNFCETCNQVAETDTFSCRMQFFYEANVTFLQFLAFSFNSHVKFP